MPRSIDDLTAIRQIAERWQSGWNTGDVEFLLSLYAEDAVLIPQSQPVLTGKKAIGIVYDSVFRDYHIEGGGDVREVEVAGDLGYFWSTYSLKACPKSHGFPIEDTGNSVFILKRQPDHSWKIWRLISNSEIPPVSSP